MASQSRHSRPAVDVKRICQDDDGPRPAQSRPAVDPEMHRVSASVSLKRLRNNAWDWNKICNSAKLREF